jgi:hypothetical protein
VDRDSSKIVGGEILDRFTDSPCLYCSPELTGPEHDTYVRKSPGQCLGATLRFEIENLAQCVLCASEVIAKDSCGSKVNPCTQFPRSPLELRGNKAEQLQSGQCLNLGALAVAEGYERGSSAQGKTSAVESQFAADFVQERVISSLVEFELRACQCRCDLVASAEQCERTCVYGQESSASGALRSNL